MKAANAAPVSRAGNLREAADHSDSTIRVDVVFQLELERGRRRQRPPARSQSRPARSFGRVFSPVFSFLPPERNDFCIDEFQRSDGE